MSGAHHGRFDPTLGTGIGFDARDLEANRRGELSPGQADALRREHTQMASQSKGMSAAMIGLLGVVFSSAFVAALDDGEPALLSVGVTGAVALIAMGSYFLYYRRLAAAQPTLQVLAVEGTVRRETNGDAFVIQIGDVTFHVFGSVFDCLIDGQRYRVYYVHHQSARWLKPISAEPLA